MAASASRQTLLRLTRTLNLNLACAGMGLLHAGTGVAMLDLAYLYNTDVKNVAQLVTTRGAGILVGSFIGGRLYDRYNTQVLSILLTLLSSVSVLITPLCVQIPYAHVASLAAGFAVGALDTGANIWLINLWPSNCGPALQIYHFAFGVGAFIAPFLTEPFLSYDSLSPTDVLLRNNTSFSATPALEGFSTGLSLNPNDSAKALWDDFGVDTSKQTRPSRLQYAFGIVSGFNALVAFLMFAVYLVDRSDCKPPIPSSSDVDHANRDDKDKHFPLILLSLLGLYIMVYLGLECSYGQMLATFAVESKLQMTKSNAAYLTSLFFLAFTVARVASAFWAAVSSPFCILLTCQVFLYVIHVILTIWGSSSATVLCALTAISGVAQAAVFATAVSWSVKFLVMTNKMMSVITIAASFGTMIPPVVVGLFIQEHPMVLMYVCFGATNVMALLFLAMYLVTRKRSERVLSRQPGDIP